MPAAHQVRIKNAVVEKSITYTLYDQLFWLQRTTLCKALLIETPFTFAAP